MAQGVSGTGNQKTTVIRIDRETHQTLDFLRTRTGQPIGQIVRRLAEQELMLTLKNGAAV